MNNLAITVNSSLHEIDIGGFGWAIQADWAVLVGG